MALHCHQPVDNFGYIFEDAYKKSYEPFLSVLEKHPGIKLSLHYSGSLLSWIIKNRPSFINRLKALIEKSQIEILTGGYYEPILTMVPSEDAKGQIEMLSSTIEKYFSKTPKGIWLAERVWDPALSSVFKDTGIKYTILDDFHLGQSGKTREEIFGHYTARGFNGFSVFPSVKKLRYSMPFREIKVTIDFLHGLSEKESARSVTFADDCEKFGLWPHTYDWVYKRGWLDKFFTALEKSDRIRTSTFSEALLESGPLGEIEIPHASYAEMFGWCNGNFNNFFKKYPESNLMKKRMLNLSREINNRENAKGPQNREKIESARKELYKSQSNCAYWHGVFGGVYLKYLRQGVYSHIIKAEDILRGEHAEKEVEILNLVSNPNNIICARNKFLSIFVDPDYAGSVFEIDYKPLSYNLGNTMSRRVEPYHEKLKRRPKIDIKAVKKKVDDEESIDLYEVLGVRERNLKRFLNYDSYMKFSFLCHAMNLKTRLSDFVKSAHTDFGEDSLFGPHAHQVQCENNKAHIKLQKDAMIHIGGRGRLLRLSKEITLEKGSHILMKFDVENLSLVPLKFIFGVEFNWSIDDPYFMQRRQKRNVKEIALADRYTGLKINHIFEEPMDVWSFPVYTLNESERGIGKNFQETSLLFHKKLALPKKGKISFTTKIRISG